MKGVDDKPYLLDQRAVVSALMEAQKERDALRETLAAITPEALARAWWIEPSGVMRRSRFDWNEPTGILADYKTTVCSDPRAFAKQAATYGYDMQAAWYQDIAADLGMDPRGFVFIVQEKEAPYLVTVVQLDADSEARGRRRNRRAIDLFKQCTDSGTWPGYVDDNQITSITLPAWAFREDEAA